VAILVTPKGRRELALELFYCAGYSTLDSLLDILGKRPACLRNGFFDKRARTLAQPFFLFRLHKRYFRTCTFV
jgi:hypothetical protein